MGAVVVRRSMDERAGSDQRRHRRSCSIRRCCRTGKVLQSASNGFAVSIEAGCNGVEATIVLVARNTRVSGAVEAQARGPRHRRDRGAGSSTSSA